MVVCVRETPSCGWNPGSGSVSRTLRSEDEDKLTIHWFKRRKYRHFDVPVNSKFASRVQSPQFVVKHSFSPLIHFTKIETKYKTDNSTGRRRIVRKSRPIKYASHRDACIFSWYSHLLNKALSEHYKSSGIGDSVIAYRALGKGNYHFSAEVLQFARDNAPVAILAFDISSFFDRLDHKLLKRRLKTILGEVELPDDWYKVFRAITNFHYVDLDDLKGDAHFRSRIDNRSEKVIASISELKAAGIVFHGNPELAKGNRRGIPQGTPISATMSNLYMIDFDISIRKCLDKIGGLYRRYSDDILVVCPIELVDQVKSKVVDSIAKEKLEIQQDKTEQTIVDEALTQKFDRKAQYLGFTFDESGAAIREASLARQWRRMRRAIRRTRRVATVMLEAGRAKQVYTKRLRRRFTHLKLYDGCTHRSVRNFSSYARCSAEAFGPGEKITGQIRRFERAVERELQALKALGKDRK